MAFLIFMISDAPGIPVVILPALQVFHFRYNAARSITIGREIEALAFEVAHVCFMGDIPFLFELAEVEAVHDDKFTLAA